MLYGMYLSASGIMTNAYRQDVIANNLANAETVGFKRDLALFQERKQAINEHPQAGDYSDPLLGNISGGILATPTLVDARQGDLEPTGNPLDVGIQGDGFFTVSNGQGKFLTRDGSFMVNNKGELVLATNQSLHVLNEKGEPIQVAPGTKLGVLSDGVITMNDKPSGKLSIVDVEDHTKFTKAGGNLLSIPEGAAMLPASPVLRAGAQERSNVDPTLELAGLMDTQRQLEANANMLKAQDQMLQQLVSSVGKIS